ncbi:MAG: bifunctional [glutamate--ammonia ligase]-adenylyl-L-tyrosine phosphorylase/[glutamate--ammonia-ligase] adenylyltransferase, partial [Gammaproteobacteria bacterium]|nr:bifunctional [glutamate--ammonia ligase]-adenylyl-L-tyrosine phosphorylase/[glutamate--ammonia-ligase] adenylyltransferase [Gammaproteobacteria bacterium]
MSRAFPVNLVLESLRPGLVVSWANFCERAGYAEQAIPAGWEPEFAAEVARVWAASDFVAQSCVRDPELMERLRGSAHFLSPRPPGSLAEELAESLSQVNDEAQLASALRKFRRQEMCRIAWRDIAGRATLDETLEDLSELADRALSEALVRLDEWQRRTWGAPTNEAGEVQTFCVLAMGKLGARELNFSSDIDLVFVYDEEGETDGARPRSNAEFFTRIGQALIRVIDAITADGFVFRVDMRLRPNGDSGPLVLPIDAFENYYAQSGRDWERYAMIKVRAVAGDLSLGERLIDLLKPFVYRRYLDFNAIDSLRDMKRMIASQALRRGAADDVKLGAGGIRDIEFTAQSLQLVWGGRHPALRTRGVREALSALGDLQFLDVDDVRRLLEAYEFHRRLENRLQAIDDRQTQRLPADDIPQARLATAMGVSDYSTLYAQWESYREIVAEAFARLVTADATPADDPAEEAKVLLWADALTGDEALDVLGTVVLKDPAAALKRLEQFKTSAAVRSLSEAGRNRLDRLMPLVLSDIAPTPDPAKTLHQALSLLEAIVRRTTYVSLLVENPEARRELITLIGASPWIAALLSRQPVLLDELLDPQSTSAEISTDGLRTDLARRLNAVEGGDVEQEMEALRAYKGAQVLHVAAAEVTGRKRLMRVSDTLTEIAEVALDSALSLSWRDISLKWGEPRCTDSEQQVRTPAFGIIG